MESGAGANSSMTSSRPYLLRALNEWILDNGMTPHILVEATAEGAVLPREYATDGKIVFNISAAAVRDLAITDQAVTFHARFGGRSHPIQIPMHAVRAIYARENGKGMIFAEDGPADRSGEPSKAEAKPSLKVIK